MKPRITLVTLGVDDLERALSFYRDGLGWPTEGIIGREFENGAVAFFDLENGLRLALWPRESIAADMNRAKSAGARVVKPAQDTFYGGYAGYFQDPDGHLWEVAFNPAWEA